MVEIPIATVAQMTAAINDAVATLNAALAGKVSTSAHAAALALKADESWVSGQLGDVVDLVAGKPSQVVHSMPLHADAVARGDSAASILVAKTGRVVTLQARGLNLSADGGNFLEAWPPGFQPPASIPVLSVYGRSFSVSGFGCWLGAGSAISGDVLNLTWITS